MSIPFQMRVDSALRAMRHCFNKPTNNNPQNVYFALRIGMRVHPDLHGLDRKHADDNKRLLAIFHPKKV